MRKRYLAMVNAGLLLVTLAHCSVHETQAASFDCTRAATKVEKMICVGAELSRMDEEMAKVYVEALPKAPDSSLLKQQQKDWLKERNLCLDNSCLVDQYQLRIGELQRIVSLIPLTNTEESHYFEKESEKLKVIQDVVRRQEFVWYYHPYRKEPEYCTEFKKDFIKGLYLEAVEPDFQTDDYSDDPRFATLNRCSDPKIHPDESFEGEFWGVEHLGGPPFRYYHLEVDGNPNNGKEYIVYYEPTKIYGGTGYVWIDPDECLIRAGAGQETRWKDTPRHLYRLTTLAKYKGELIMVGISPTPWAPNPTSYYFNMKRFDNKKEPRGCHFNFNFNNNKPTTVQPTEYNKENQK